MAQETIPTLAPNLHRTTLAVRLVRWSDRQLAELREILEREQERRRLKTERIQESRG